MTEARLTFKRENREGIIPIGTYLADAARRYGVHFEARCIPAEGIHYCSVSVSEGGDSLSAPTSTESKYFSENEDEPNARLACQAKITQAGEIVVMTKEKKEAKEAKEADSEEAREKYAKEFAELPLEKKIAELVQLEAITLGETFSFIMNSPYLVFDKVMDVMAEFGLKKEEEGKRAVRPEEHVADAENNGKKGRGKKGGTAKSAEPDAQAPPPAAE